MSVTAITLIIIIIIIITIIIIIIIIRSGRPSGRISSPVKDKIFLYSTASRQVLGTTQPPIQSVTGALFPGENWPGREADHSLPTIAEVKNTWIYYSSLPHTPS
jgi:hypothetical protein